MKTNKEVTDKRIKLFISYSRRNLKQAVELADALEKDGFEAKIDIRDLPYGEEFKSELETLIRQSDIVLWLLSPDSIASRWCTWELNEVMRQSKKLVPIHLIPSGLKNLPEVLAKINILPALEIYNHQKHFKLLTDVLRTDIVWTKSYTRLSELSEEWKTHNRKTGFLSGKQLKSAEKWLENTPKDAPSPKSEVIRLIQASGKRKSMLNRIAFLTAAVIAFGIFGTYYFVQIQKKVAEYRTRDFAATNNAQQSQRLFEKSDNYTNWRAEGVNYIVAPDFKEPLTLLDAAISQYKNTDDNEVPISLKQAMRGAISHLPPWERILNHSGMIEKLSYNRQGNRLASLTFDGILNIWNTKNYKAKKIRIRPEGDPMEELDLSWAGPGHIILNNGKLINTKTGSVKKLNTPEVNWINARFCPSGKYVAHSNQSKIILSKFNDFRYQGNSKTIINPFENQTRHISWNTGGNMVTFSDGQKMEVVSTDTNILNLQIEGRFLGWSQKKNHLYIKRSDGVVVLEINQRFDTIQVPFSTDNLLWSDALTLNEDEIQELLFPNQRDEDIIELSYSNHATLSPDLKNAILLYGNCNMGNAGGSCEDVSIDIFNSSLWITESSYFTIKENIKIRSFYGHIAPPTHLAWHPNGETFATCASRTTGSFTSHDMDKSVIVWSINDSKFYDKKWSESYFLDLSKAQILIDLESTFDLPSFYVNMVKWDDDNKIIVNFTDETSGAAAYEYKAGNNLEFDLASKSWKKNQLKLNRFYFINSKTKDPIKSRKIHWSNKGKFWHQPVDSENAKNSNKVIIYSHKKEDGIEIVHPGFVSQVRWSPDGAKILTTCSDGYARVFKAEDGLLVDIVSLSSSSDLEQRIIPDFADWSPDGKWILLGSRASSCVAIVPFDNEVLKKEINRLLKNAPPQGTTRDLVFEKLNE